MIYGSLGRPTVFSYNEAQIIVQAAPGPPLNLCMHEMVKGQPIDGQKLIIK